MKQVLYIIMLLTLPVGTTALAQINSPPPALQGQASFHLWSVPGVIVGGGLRTFFACTNTTDNTIRVGVEVFGSAGGAAANDPSAESLNVAPGGTVLFGTSAAVGFSVDGVLGAGAISKGSARASSPRRGAASSAAPSWRTRATPRRPQ